MTAMPRPVLRLVDALGRPSTLLNGWTRLEIGGDDGAPLTLVMEYDTGHPTYALLADGVEVVVSLGGVELVDGRFVLDEMADDEVTDGEPGTWKGSSSLYSLAYAQVYPETYPALTVPGTRFVAGTTPGYALRRLVEAAQTRGWWPALTLGFGDGEDSSGAPWPETLPDTLLEMGQSYLDVLTSWADRHLAVARVTGGTVLQLYAYGNHGADLIGPDGVQLLRGYDLTEGPKTQSWRDTVSALLAVTDADGVPAITVTDPTATSRYGRREGFLSQSQVDDVDALESIADATIGIAAQSRDSFTYGLTCTGKHLPIVHYDRGDVVEVRPRGDTRQMRVRQLTVAWDKDGTATGSAAFGHRYRDPADVLQDRIDQLTGRSRDGGLYGSPVVGGGDSYTPGSGTPTRDTIPPKPPTDLALQDVVYEIAGGYLRALATVSWVPPVQNTDNTTLLDLGAYGLQWRRAGWESWQPGGTVAADAITATLQLEPNHTYEWRIRAQDAWGNQSVWAASTLETEADDVPPALAPSAPVVEAVLFGALQVGWDGLAAGGSEFPTDVWFAQVHVSTTSGFTPDTGTHVANLSRPADGLVAETVFTDLDAGTTYYVRLVAVDAWGNTGPPSAQGSGVPIDVFSSVASEFSDFSNLVADGSFERPETRAGLLASTDLQESTDGVTWTAGGGWSFVENTGQHVLLRADEVTDWTARSGSTPPTGQSADGTYKDGGGLARWGSAADIAYDPNTLYRVAARVRVDRNSTGATRAVWVGVESKTATGSSSFVNLAGANSPTGMQMPAALQRPQTQTDGWRTWEGWFTGTVAAGAAATEGTLAAPAPLPSGTTRMGVALLMDHDAGNGRWTAAWGELTGVPVSSHGDWALRVAGSAVGWRRAVLARLDAQGGAEQWYVRFRCRLTGTTGSTPVVFGGVRLLDEAGSVIPTSTLPSRSFFTKDGWMVVEGRVSRDTAARYLVAATAELYVGVLGLTSGQQMSFDEVSFRQVATSVLIADAAIDDAKIVSLTASKITAGTMSATVVLSGEFRTDPTPNRGTVINSSGVKLYDTSGNNTVSLNSADGSASFTGTIGSVDIVGYARVINPLQLSQMYMHPGFSGTRYPVLAADTALAAQHYPGTLQLSAGQLIQDSAWRLTTPRVSFQGTTDTTSFYEVSQFSLELVSNAVLSSSDPGTWPTRIGGRARWTVPYGTGNASGWPVVTTRPFFEFVSHYSAENQGSGGGFLSTSGSAADHGRWPGIHWGNKYGHEVGIRMTPGSGTLSDVAVEFTKQYSQANVEVRAQAFTPLSGSRHKEGIRPTELRALDVVLAHPSLEWSYRGEQRRRLGPMADDLPPQVADGDRTDLGSMIGLLWLAVQELAEEVRGG
jgi:hypothetical protein